jgi:hypothetical protein
MLIKVMFMIRLRAILLIATLSCITACEFKVNVSEKNELKGAGIKFQIPMETSAADTSEHKLSYESKRFKAQTDGDKLWIDDASYGSLNHGDIVDFYEYPTIKVNGEIRSTQGD